MHEDTEAKKLMGGGTVRTTALYKASEKTFIFVLGTLQGLETSAARSQSFNLERELPEFCPFPLYFDAARVAAIL